MALSYPSIDPIAIQIGPIAIRWYALAYVVSLLLGWQLMRLMARRGLVRLSEIEVDDFLVWATLGIVLGGRLGYVLFYNPAYYLAHPLDALATWQGGMSFHGGLLGVMVATAWFARRRELSLFAVGDAVAVMAPIGLFFGRLSNFINGELYGRVSDVPWAMVFPYGGPEPRHPSQLYEAGLEGLLLFLILIVLAFRTKAMERAGLLSGIFLTGYAISRLIVELFRQPDAHIGFLAGGATMGQLLSLPMLFVGLWLIVRARRAA